MTYGVLVLPQLRSMTPALLAKLKQLVQSGATIIGEPPVKSPSLSDYPQCDEETRQIAAELWGTNETVLERSIGAGRVIRALAGSSNQVQVQGNEPPIPYGAARSRSSLSAPPLLHRQPGLKPDGTPTYPDRDRASSGFDRGYIGVSGGDEAWM
jgi:hypothetical protein